MAKFCVRETQLVTHFSLTIDLKCLVVSSIRVVHVPILIDVSRLHDLVMDHSCKGVKVFMV